MKVANFIEQVETSLSVDNEYKRLSENNTFSACKLGICRMKFENYSDDNLKKAFKYIEESDCGIKGYADYIDLGIVGYNTEIVKKKTPNNKTVAKIRIVLIKKYIFFGWSTC